MFKKYQKRLFEALRYTFSLTLRHIFRQIFGVGSLFRFLNILDKGGWYVETQEKTSLVCFTHYTNKFQIRLESGTIIYL